MELFYYVIFTMFLVSFFPCLFGIKIYKIIYFWISIISIIITGMFFRFGMYLFEGMIKWGSFEFLY